MNLIHGGQQYTSNLQGRTERKKENGIKKMLNEVLFLNIKLKSKKKKKTTVNQPCSGE
jgi:hypothetical protein